jgi:hypothetical protein
MLYIGISFIATCGLLLSCEKETIIPEQKNTNRSNEEVNMPEELERPRQICGPVKKKDLLANGRRDIGDVYIFNDTKYLYVNAIADNYNLFKNAYLYTGSKSEIPETREGDLNYQMFTHTQETLSYERRRTFKIPLSGLPGRFIVSLMVETKAEKAQDIDYIFHSWADGHPYGVTTGEIGRIFSYLKGVCETVDHIESDAIFSEY